MTIDEIYKKEEISVRSYHVCKYNELNSISDLKKYYYKNKSFEKLRNCGRKSNEELIEICNKYPDDNFENKEIEVKKENPLKSIITNLTRVQREVINSFIFVNTNSLSVRSKNAISLHLKNNLKVKNFTEKVLLSESFNVQNIKNVGAKCVPEIEIYISIIKDFIFEVNQTRDEKYLIALKNKFLIQRTFDIPLVPSEILESESIFQLTKFLLNQNAFFDETQTVIVKLALKLFNNQKELTLDEIAEQVDLSRERVRQIRKLCLEALFDKLLFISNFNDDLFQKYSIDVESIYIEINTDILNKINQSNNTNFSREFITFILSAYLKDSFSVVGNYEDVLQPKYFNSRNRHNWNNFYLVEKELSSEFDFTSFSNDISNRLSDRIEESYFFNFKSYLSKFLSNNNIDILDLLLPICEKIINEEFEIYLDLDESINFKRNTTRQAHEYAFEALDHLGKPSKVKEIFEKVVELHPNYDTEEAKIRVSMKRKNGFVPIGRKSVFGLKKWESELDNFKGGTIRDIVEEYLMQFSVPKHISHITEHVLKYRPKSNQYSILQNLKLDESGLYIFFKGSHIGLTTKKYESDFKRISEVQKTDKKTWEERFEMLQNFVSIEKRLPFSNGVPEKEIKLYRWLNVQKSKQNKGKLTENKEDKLNSLLAKYPSINGRRRLNSNEKYQELISFVTNNHRLPSANKNGEENLYQFFYKQRKLFDKNELDSKEQNKFIEVAKLLQNIKYEN
ncbi:helicase associated domain-containing protein [Ichthyenterobacterium magnum]|uniref:Sigma-70-like protein n=1 Tax=Ichthyenterobacterium magnum TaxID=1230530 RepID=A0A420DEC7_9FLAO|nr:Helicase associated domain protein [Ichthyenterobacterium magnum]RKE90288.1 sigma-70-like protein [Ichthyenterobacterium magnum]